MFIGHLALGFAAKKVTPQISLAMLLTAAQFPDVLWPVLVALGVEHVRIARGYTAFTPLEFVSYPYSHSLLLLVVWGVLLGLVTRQVVREKGVVLVIAALVVSHWVLDFVTHRPDMPLYPGSPRYGLGLWNSVAGTLAVELSMYAVGLWIYIRATRSRDPIGRWAFIALAVFLGVVYLGNVGSAPSSVRLLYIGALVGAAILTAWAWWADRHREPITWQTTK
jgi:hypothetical protein